MILKNIENGYKEDAHFQTTQKESRKDQIFKLAKTQSFDFESIFYCFFNFPRFLMLPDLGH
jgi:hypothetical protein